MCQINKSVEVDYYKVAVRGSGRGSGRDRGRGRATVRPNTTRCTVVVRGAKPVGATPHPHPNPSTTPNQVRCNNAYRIIIPRNFSKATAEYLEPEPEPKP